MKKIELVRVIMRLVFLFLFFCFFAWIRAEDVPMVPLRLFGEIKMERSDFILNLKIENVTSGKIFFRLSPFFEPDVETEYIERNQEKYLMKHGALRLGGTDILDEVRLSKEINVLDSKQVRQLDVNINKIIDPVLFRLKSGDRLVGVRLKFKNCVLATGVDFKTIDEVQFGTVYFLPELKITQPFEFGGLFFEEREGRVCIRLILPWSFAQGSGLMKGDVIKEVNGTHIDKMEDLEKAIGTDAREASFSIAGKDGIKKMVILRGEARDRNRK